MPEDLLHPNKSLLEVCRTRHHEKKVANFFLLENFVFFNNLIGPNNMLLKVPQ